MTVPSSELDRTRPLQNCRQVTADWCLFGPEGKPAETLSRRVADFICNTFQCPVSRLISPWSVWRHCPVRMSHTRTVESAFPDTRMLSRSSIPLVSDWWPVSVWTHPPEEDQGFLVSVIKPSRVKLFITMTRVIRPLGGTKLGERKKVELLLQRRHPRSGSHFLFPR